MGDFKTVAAVTQALQHVLTEGLRRHSEYENTPVTIGSPHQMSTDRSTEQKTINLFLYHVRPDPSLRNLNLPIYESDRMVNVPTIGLDLYYLLSFYGPKRNDLEAEYLLGIAVSTLNAKPLLQESDFRASRRAGVTSSVEGLGAIDTVAVTPMTLTIEEMQRLWAMFPNTPYTLSMSYCASAALLVSDGTAQPQLPVSSQPVTPTAAAAPPTISALTSADGDRGVVVFGSTLTITGAQLSAAQVEVEIGGVRIAVDPATVSATQIQVEIDDRKLGAGQSELEVLQLDAAGHVLASSNSLPLDIVPLIRAPKVEIDQPAAGAPGPHTHFSGHLTLDLRPATKSGQRVGALLFQINGDQTYAFAAESGDVGRTKLSIPFTDVAPGRYLIQLQVDGVSSRLTQQPGEPFQHPRVRIPPRSWGRGA